MSTGNYLNDLFGLHGLTAIVIGGTGTLGGSFCDALAGAGAHVLVVGRNEEHGTERVRLIQERGGSAEYFSCDATRHDDLNGLVSHLRANGREANILINGHEPCYEGFIAPNDYQIILDCCGQRAAYLILPVGVDLSHDEIMERVGWLEG